MKKDFEKNIKALFDYQDFEHNTNLDYVINRESNCLNDVVELTDFQLNHVAAAGNKAPLEIN